MMSKSVSPGPDSGLVPNASAPSADEIRRQLQRILAKGWYTIGCATATNSGPGADPEQLGAILRRLPAGWESRDLQLVLHAKVIGNAPGQPEVEDWHVW